MAAAYGEDESYAQKVIAKLRGIVGGPSSAASFPALSMSELTLHDMPPDGDCFFAAVACGISLSKGRPVVEYGRRAAIG